MANMKVRTFEHKNGSFEDQGEWIVDTTDADRMKHVRDLNKKASFLAVPVLDDGTIDVDMVEQMLTPGRRASSNWTAEMVEFAHDRRAHHNETDIRIMLDLYKELDAEVSKESVAKTLRQEINTEFDLTEGLREAATKATPKKGTRNKSKLSDEDKATIVEKIDGGASGSSLDKEYNVSNGTCNKIYRDMVGYRRNRS